MKLRIALTLATGSLISAGLSAQTTTNDSKEEALKLSPFEVTSETDKSYGALNSNSVTAFSVELNKLPITADVFGEAFMTDVGATNVEQMIQTFSAGAGYAAATPDSYAANGQYLDRNAGSLSLRGLSVPSVQVNGFFPTGGGGASGTGITSSFDVERVEVISGPQSLLYGVSGSGGVINNILKQAQFNRASNGALKFQLDQYGHKLGQIDYGIGGKKAALRVALLNQTLGGRRVFIGGPLKGAYAQVAFKPFENTVLRYSYERTLLERVNAIAALITLQGLSTANDARNGQSLRWLLLTGQTKAAANGQPSGAGDIMNGNLNWDNIDSLAGSMYGENQQHSLQTFVAETRWNSWLSTQASFGYRTEKYHKVGNASIAFLAPNVAANPTGDWAIAQSNGLSGSLDRPVRQKVARFSALATNDLFGGRAHSQTVIGVDFTRSDASSLFATYVRADSDFNPIKSAATANNGFTLIPTVYWGVGNGAIYQPPLWKRDDNRITYNGVNYVRTVTNYSTPSLVSATNPLGLTGTGTGDNQRTVNIQSGIYGANFTDWMGGKLSTLLGVRAGKAFLRGSLSAASPASVKNELLSEYTGFNAGASYAVTNWLRPYAQISTNYVPPSTAVSDPYGVFNKTSSGIGEEAGFKISNPTNSLSGSINYFISKAKNEIISNPTQLTSEINPPGLNGRLGAPGNSVNADRETRGMQISLTAAPTSGWRMRFSAATIDAKISTTRSFDQLYNDQFYASGRQVTYQDGTPVYVLPTATQVATATTAGAVPLTIDLMNNSTSRYYANPVAVSSMITSSSAVATILQTTDPVHGRILTGKVGLPISALQIAPNLASPPPGNITVLQSGDRVTGSPRYSANFTNVYTFREQGLRGVKVGGTVTARWKNGAYYYYPATVSAPNSRTLFSMPDLVSFSGILGYERKFKRFGFATQLNITNMFNKYHVVALPSYLNGWGGPNNATFDQQPRLYEWSTTLSF